MTRRILCSIGHVALNLSASTVYIGRDAAVGASMVWLQRHGCGFWQKPPYAEDHKSPFAANSWLGRVASDVRHMPSGHANKVVLCFV